MSILLRCEFASAPECGRGCLVAGTEDQATRAEVARVGGAVLGQLREFKKDTSTEVTGQEVYRALGTLLHDDTISMNQFNGHLVTAAATTAFSNESCSSA